MLISNAHALDWWVEDEAQVTPPEAPLDVRVGPAGGEGLWYDQGELVFVHEGDQERSSVAEDPKAQVLLARSWASQLEAADSGWTPSSPPERVAERAPELSPRAEPLRLGVSAGAGLQPSRLGPPVGLSAELLWTGDRFGLGALGTAGLFEQDIEEGWTALRVGVGLQGTWTADLPTGRLEAALGVQARYLALRHPDLRAAHWLGAASPRVTWWGQPRDHWWVGAGLGLTLDGGVARWGHPEGLLRAGVDLQPATVHLGFHLARSLALGPE
jgi:hypothetical protein